MNVLIIKNIAGEGPGTIEEFLREKKIPYSVVDLHKGGTASAFDSFTHLVIMGGPMAVYEMDRHPFLKGEAKLIELAVKSNKHVLGVCLGAQMVAHVLGSRVYAGSGKEIGWYRVDITPEGMRDPLMAALALPGAAAADVFQWHGDTFDLPAGAQLLASSALYPNQAFRYSDGVYALQFHIEVTPVIVHDWLKQERGIDTAAIDAESNRIFDPYRLRAMNFYRGFFKS
jgi:GMP synthase-like glutamine amidotransferase